MQGFSQKNFLVFSSAYGLLPTLGGQESSPEIPRIDPSESKPFRMRNSA
jgi:hypothetical protein